MVKWAWNTDVVGCVAPAHRQVFCQGTKQSYVRLFSLSVGGAWSWNHSCRSGAHWSAGAFMRSDVKWCARGTRALAVHTNNHIRDLLMFWQLYHGCRPGRRVWPEIFPAHPPR